MAELLLIHGAWHGAWCWDELIPLLEARGHRVSAIDLPGLGADQTPNSEITLDSYAQRIAGHVRSLPGKVWLVGHSMGGLAITQAAELVPDRLEGSVYVTAAVPLNGQSMSDAFAQTGEATVAGRMEFDPETNTAFVPDEHLRDMFYHLCSDAQVERARRLLRPRQAMAPTGAKVSTSPERFGAVPRFYVECLQDRALPIGFQRGMHQAAGMTGVVTLDSDHSPFFSRRAELAAAIDSFTAGTLAEHR